MNKRGNGGKEEGGREGEGRESTGRRKPFSKATCS